MNGDLISREALITAIQDHFDNIDTYFPSAFIKEVEDAPAVFDDKAYSDGYTQGTCDCERHKDMDTIVAQVNFDKEQLQEIVDKAKAEFLASHERTKGKWLETYELIGTFLHPVLICSVCGARAVDKLNFCPDCGADLRKEE